MTACNSVVATSRLANAFNEGVLDSTADPAYDRGKRATDTVMWRMRDELGSGYFGQGAKDAQVVKWLAALDKHAAAFIRDAVATSVADVTPTDDSCADDSGTPQKQVSASQQKIQRFLEREVPDVAPPTAALCTLGDPSQPNVAAIEQLSDYVRFSVALSQAGGDAAALVDEGFAPIDEATAGASAAFEHTADYLVNRNWRRQWDHHVAGLVVKGGAATGMFSAGVVWVALNILRECTRAHLCDPATTGFSMASGTSTGATIVAASDIFDTALRAGDDTAREKAISDYLHWYSCSSMNDLYCVRNHPAFNLARGAGGKPDEVQDSMLDFDGLASKIEDNYHCSEMGNGMELILNTVDFRTGRLYSLSDQDPATLLAPWDVAKAVVSSAALPFIVRPTYHLPVDPMKGAGNFAYLDGGIRSELPLLALVRRGVERLLVVSSGASVTGDEGAIPNALGMATRYIDISTGGVTESEIDHAKSRAVASRLAEYELCTAMLRHDRSCKNGSTAPRLCVGKCDPEALCAGDFAHACDRDTKRKTMRDDEWVVDQTFRMTSVWRNEDRVAGLPGYSFKPTEQRRLILAGAEAARSQCAHIASTLGIDVGTGPKQVPLDTLYAWCTPNLPSVNDQCTPEELAHLDKPASDCSNDDGPQPRASTHSEVQCARRSR
jgi:predicted acylesterase/phospholipase RssA